MEGLVLVLCDGTALDADCQFGDFLLLLIGLDDLRDLEVERMGVRSLVRGEVLATEPVEAFKADEEPVEVFLVVCKSTGSEKHLTHWSLNIFLPWSDLVKLLSARCWQSCIITI